MNVLEPITAGNAEFWAFYRLFVADLAQFQKSFYKPQVGLRRAGDASRARPPNARWDLFRQ
jgi:hypothetical protein